ncbi:MAG: hypothetical protein WA734_02405 [Candidatus Acidiferrales bacterium]
MKSALIATFILSLSAGANADVSPVQFETSVPSVVITYAGQGTDPSVGIYYRFSLKNNSTHGVTGFHLFEVPESIQKTNGTYACDTSCTGVGLNGDSADPMIKPGQSFDLHVPPKDAARLPTIWIDAAVFDNYTYEGDKKIASRLGLSQIATQAAFDRVKPLLDGISTDTANSDSGKAVELLSELKAISVEVEPEMIQRFNYWFPNTADCNHDFDRIMQNTAAAALRSIEGQLETYIAGADGTGAPFSAWLASVNNYMHKGHVGCVGCSDLPSAASSAPAEFQPCPAAGASAANQLPTTSNR